MLGHVAVSVFGLIAVLHVFSFLYIPCQTFFPQRPCVCHFNGGVFFFTYHPKSCIQCSFLDGMVNVLCCFIIIYYLFIYLLFINAFRGLLLIRHDATLWLHHMLPLVSSHYFHSVMEIIQKLFPAVTQTLFCFVLFLNTEIKLNQNLSCFFSFTKQHI